MDSLSHDGAVIDLRTKLITLSAKKATPRDPNPCRHALNVLEDHVTIPPRSSVIIPVGTVNAEYIEGVIESDQRLLLHHDICVARGIAELHEGKASVIVTNYSKEYGHLSRGTEIAYIKKSSLSAMHLPFQILTKLER